MNHLTLPILLPIIGAAFCLIFKDRQSWQSLISGVTIHLGLFASILLMRRALTGNMDVLHFGSWDRGLGIVFVLDAFAAIMLLLSSIIQSVTWWFVQGGATPPIGQRTYFHPLLLIIAAGVNWAFLTGDLFNLFVSFELLLICSYILLTDGTRTESLRESYRFLLINGVAGTLFLMAAGLIYGAYGTLNLAELSYRVHNSQEGNAIIFGSFLLIVFGVKAAIFPLFTWLPTAYPAIPLSILPFLTAMLTKVGVYTLYRIYPLIFMGAAPDWFQPLLLGIAAITMLLGVMAALSQWTIREILSIHIISQIGYMVFGLALLTPLGLAGGILSISHNILVKTALFLVAAIVIMRSGHDRLKDLGGYMTRSPLLAILFFLSAVSLAGLPPFSGFYSKWILTLEGFMEGRTIVTTAAVVTGLFTLASMVKIWLYTFWGEEKSAPGIATPRLGLTTTAALVGLALVYTLASGPITDAAELAATQLLDVEAYQAAILAPPLEVAMPEVAP